MPKNKQKVSKSVESTIKLNAGKFAIAGGLTAGICVAITTIAGIMGFFAEYNALIVSIYGFLGYSISWLGVLLGAIYGFVDGFVLTYIFAMIYNKLIS